jgi:hypothetical protein
LLLAKLAIDVDKERWHQLVGCLFIQWRAERLFVTGSTLSFSPSCASKSGLYWTNGVNVYRPGVSVIAVLRICMEIDTAAVLCGSRLRCMSLAV